MPDPSRSWHPALPIVFVTLLILALAGCSKRSVVEPSPVVDARPVAKENTTATPEPPPTVRPSSPITGRLKTPQTMAPIQSDEDSANSQGTGSSTQSPPAIGSASKPPVVALLQGAQADTEAGQLDLAAQKLERALRIDSRDPVPWHELASLRLQQLDYHQAIQLASRSNALLPAQDPLRQENWRIMLRAYNALGDSDNAARAKAKLQ